MRPLPFVLAGTDAGPLIVSRLDCGQYPDGGIYGVGAQLFATASFDPEEVSLGTDILNHMRDERGDGVVAVDCGANVGVHTVTWAKEMTGWGEVVAFEAQERIFYALAGNVALANVFNARACYAAVGAAPGKILVPRPDYLRAASFGSIELRYDEATEFVGQAISYVESDMQPVVMVSIDSLALPRLDLLKVDVERMEMDVLVGARETIERCRPALMVEWIKVGIPEITAFIEPIGYTLEVQGTMLIGTPA